MPDSSNSELETLKRENTRLKQSLSAFMNACAVERSELMRQLQELEAELQFRRENVEARLGRMVSHNLAQWHAPLSLPAKLKTHWINEIKSGAPDKLGGKDFNKVISAFDTGAFDAVEELLDSARPTNYIRACAWTELARRLRLRRNFADAANASRRAYESDPRDYRLKWHAFRLRENGQSQEASAILAFLSRQTQFSDTEEKGWRDIEAEAAAMLEFESRLELAGRLEGIDQTDSDNGSCLGHFDDAELLALYAASGLEDLLAKLQTAMPAANGLVATRLFQLCAAAQDPETRFKLAKAAMDLEPDFLNMRSFFWIAFHGGHLLEARDILKRCQQLKEGMSQSELRALKLMRSSLVSQLDLLDLAQPASKRAFEPHPGRICYVLHNSLPWSSGGYATRAHGLAVALAAHEHEVIAITRPGYPLDIVKGIQQCNVDASPEVINGVKYQRIPHPRRNSLSATKYMAACADAYEKKFRELEPQFVIAASNHVTALPALIAARRLGLPFIYEVRGLWEITALSREKDFGDTASFQLQKIFEAETCRLADKVFTLTQGLKRELINRGVPEDKISIAPNGCDPDRFGLKDRDPNLARKFQIPPELPVIGYIGTFVAYEGLEDLANACGMLKERGREFRLLLVGNENASGKETGPITAEIRRIAEERGFANWLIMPGRIPHSEVADYYSLIDIAPFPRKPWPVCEIVSPMKPLEAMAMSKALLVSSVQALAEMVEDEYSGLVFPKGDVNALADKLERLLGDEKLRFKLGFHACAFARVERNWNKIAAEMSREIKKLA